MPSAAPVSTATRGRWAGLLAVVLGGAVLAVALAVRGRALWEPSEGVYALTSRQLLEGADLYGDVVAAQPPTMFLLGAGLLVIDDSLEWLRLAVGLLQLTAGLLGARVAWRLTNSLVAAGLTAPVALALPWAVHDAGRADPGDARRPRCCSGGCCSPGVASTPRGSVCWPPSVRSSRCPTCCPPPSWCSAAPTAEGRHAGRSPRSPSK